MYYTPTFYSDTVSEHPAAFKLMAGVRPLPFFGAIATGYNDAPNRATLSMQGEAAFGVLYLPLPRFDLFAKAGMAVIQSTLTANSLRRMCITPSTCLSTNVVPAHINRTNAEFAAGAGAQFRFGSWAIRGEYEYFTAADAHPALLSVGVRWTL